MVCAKENYMMEKTKQMSQIALAMSIGESLPAEVRRTWAPPMHITKKVNAYGKAKIGGKTTLLKDGTLSAEWVIFCFFPSPPINLWKQ